jgi:hypothetical protein
MKSKFMSINSADFVKGLIVAVLTVIIVGVENIIQTGTLPTWAQLQSIGLAALGAGIAYLIKNLFTNSQDQLFSGETKVALKK